MHMYVCIMYIYTYNAAKMCLSAPCMKIACGDAHAHYILRGDMARFVSQQLRRPYFTRLPDISSKYVPWYVCFSYIHVNTLCSALKC